MITDRTGEDDATFAALLARVEAAEEAPESVRERVARAMWVSEGGHPDDWGSELRPFRQRQERQRRLAAAALSVLRGEGWQP